MSMRPLPKWFVHQSISMGRQASHAAGAQGARSKNLQTSESTGRHAHSSNEPRIQQTNKEEKRTTAEKS